MFFDKSSAFSASFSVQYSAQLFTGYEANDQPVFSVRIQKCRDILLRSEPSVER
jgi:hypothetical protein